MKANDSTLLAPSECSVVFGGAADAPGGAAGLRVALPVLAGVGVERLLTGASEPSSLVGYTLCRSGSWLAGFAASEPGMDLEEASGDLYRRLFAAAAGYRIYRIWNYVPRINAVVRGMENYRRFCRGRSLAFEAEHGRGFERMLPAASAVGAPAGPLAVAFVAGRAEPRHFENPLQTPAFAYPAEYGPRPPSFARATSVAIGRERRVFISGTAAIRGHASVAVGDLEGQVDCTVENLGLIEEATGVKQRPGETSCWQRAFKVFLRNPADLRTARSRLERGLFRPGDAVCYIQTDICRADLLVEIEATLVSGP
jgi:enamine deaminase RidA (YjgF/YER057c/UK114 family)